jgi:hypothetical protein
MQSRNARFALAAALVAVAVGTFVVLSGGDDEDGGGGGTVADTGPGRVAVEDGGGAEPPQIPLIVVRNGKPVGGVQELDFTAGETIRFKVRSDVADEVHFHGYDVARAVKAGGTVGFDVPADIEGGFEVELEQRGEQLAEITVSPG